MLKSILNWRMSMSEELKRWTSKRKAALVIELLKGQTTISEASRQYDLTPSEIQLWIDDAQSGMENALRAKPKDISEQCEQKISELTSAYGEAMLENKALKKLQALLNQTES
jgi:transposase-like protein